MITEENKKKYKTLMLGLALGLIPGFFFGLLVSGPTHIPVEPFGLFRMEAFYTTFVGCMITIGFVLVYLYIVEWSDLKASRAKKSKTEEVSREEQSKTEEVTE